MAVVFLPLAKNMTMAGTRLPYPEIITFSFGTI